MMSHQLKTFHTFVTHLLPPTRSVRLCDVTVEPAYVVCGLTTMAMAVC